MERKTAKRTKSQAGRWSRTKGHDFERRIAAALRCVFPEARRHLEYQDAEANGVDLVNTGRYLIQCKKLKNYAPISTLGEIQYFPDMGDVPILVTAGDTLPPVVVIPFDEFLFLLTEAKGGEK